MSRTLSPNVITEYLALLLPIPNVPGSNLCYRLPILTGIFVAFLTTSKQMQGQELELCQDCFPPQPSQFIIS